MNHLIFYCYKTTNKFNDDVEIVFTEDPDIPSNDAWRKYGFSEDAFALELIDLLIVNKKSGRVVNKNWEIMPNANESQSRQAPSRNY